MKKKAEMEKITEEILNLKKSPLYKYRIENNYLPVIGEGALDAKVMFVGEAPGKNEALTSKPFCGRSGKFLDEMLLSVGLSRADTYITSVVKDRPQDNRDPTPKEIALYGPYLDRQLEIIKPKVIVLLGRISMKYLFEKAGIIDKLESITLAHGKVFKGKLPHGEVILIPQYHPAYGLYNQSKRPELFKDFGVIKKYLKRKPRIFARTYN